MSDGLVGDEFTSRPDDDELAFLHYEKLFREWIDSIANVMHQARAIEDARPGLPAPDKHIQASPKQISPPSGELWVPQAPPKPPGDDLDDEIPF